MPQKSETPADTGAWRNSCAGMFRDRISLIVLHEQFLIAAHNLRPEWAAMLAAFASGGGAHHG